MGRLAKLLQKRNESNKHEEVTETKEVELKRYNPSWLLKVSNATGFIINEDSKKVDKILEALNRRNGHCPCGGNGSQFMCPCVNMREKGICKCGLFENVTPVQPKGNVTAKIKENDYR